MNQITENIRELCHMPGVKSLLALVASVFLELVGHPESAAMWLFVLMLFDLVLGLVRAWHEGQFSGERLSRGAWKFFRYWMAVAVFVMADAALKKALPIPLSIRDTFIAYLAVNEAFSCVDHLSFFGMPVPEPFLRRLRSYRDDCLAGKWSEENRRGEGEDHASEGEHR